MNSFELVWAPSVGILSTLTNAVFHLDDADCPGSHLHVYRTLQLKWQSDLVNVLGMPTRGAQTRAKLVMGSLAKIGNL